MMKTTSIKATILRYIEGSDWLSGSELEEQAYYWGAKASTVSRRARELYEDGQLDRKLVKGCVWYKKVPTVVLDGYEWRPEPKQEGLFETAPKRFKMEG